MTDMKKKAKHGSGVRYWKLPWRNVCVCAFLVLFIFLSSFSVLNLPMRGFDKRASQYLKSTMLKAGVTFALARGLNATISLVQESRVGFDFIVSGEIALFELLDPVNDLVEKFSTVMLMSTVSLGIQSLLLKIGQWVGITVFLTSALVLFLLLVLLPDRMEKAKIAVRGIAWRVLAVAVVVRIAIPLTALVCAGLDSVIFENRYSEAKQELENAYREGKEANLFIQEYGLEGSEQEAEEEMRKNEEPKRELFGNTGGLNMKKMFSRVVESLKNITIHIIDMIVVFILQTIVIPLITLWALVRIARGLFGTRFRLAMSGMTEKLFENKPKG
jgi:hypothetical protein